MTDFNPILNSFNAGEFSPLLYGRTDIQKYRFGAATIENFWVLPEGALMRRSGTRYVNGCKDNSKKSRLVQFIFSTSDALVLEFSENAIRFFTNEAVLSAPTTTFVDGNVNTSNEQITITDHRYVQDQGPFQLTSSGTLPTGLSTGTDYYVNYVDDDTITLALTAGGSAVDITAAVGGGTHTITPNGTVPHEVTTTYTESELFEMQFAQSADTMYIAHASHAPAQLVRNSSQDWVLSDVTFVDGPYLSINDDDLIKVQTSSSSAGAGVTLTATSAVFSTTNDVSRKFTLEDSTETAAAGDRVYGTITAVASTTSATWTIERGDPGVPTATDFIGWAKGAWNSPAAVGYPGTVSFYQQRLWWAGQASGPGTFHASVTNDFTNFAPNRPRDASLLDTNALNFTLDSNQVDQIVWMAPLRSMLIATEAAIWNVQASTTREAISPTNVNAAISSITGAKNVMPVSVGNVLVYLTSFGRRMFAVGYSFSDDDFISEDLTTLADHVLTSGGVQLAYSQEPHSVVAAVRDDGEMATLTYDRPQNVFGWSRQIVGGSFGSGSAVIESVAAIPDPNETHHQFWVTVKRTINGSTVRYVEFFEEDFESTDDIEDAFFVDCGLTYDSTSTSTISNLDHLEGETVSILADGAVQADKTVSSGSITLDTAASTVQVGLSYNSNLQTLRLDATLPTGSIQGKKQRIIANTLRLDTTVGGKMGRDSSNIDPLQFRDAGDPTDTPVSPFTGDYRQVFNGQIDDKAQVYVRQDQPLPMTVVAVIPEADVGR